jgi:hypothetical protein
MASAISSSSLQGRVLNGLTELCDSSLRDLIRSDNVLGAQSTECTGRIQSPSGLFIDFVWRDLDVDTMASLDAGTNVTFLPQQNMLAANLEICVPRSELPGIRIITKQKGPRRKEKWQVVSSKGKGRASKKIKENKPIGLPIGHWNATCAKHQQIQVKHPVRRRYSGMRTQDDLNQAFCAQNKVPTSMNQYKRRPAVHQTGWQTARRR